MTPTPLTHAAADLRSFARVVREVLPEIAGLMEQAAERYEAEVEREERR